MPTKKKAPTESFVTCTVKIGVIVRVQGKVTKEKIADAANAMIDDIGLGPFEAEDVLDGYAVEVDDDE